MIPTPSPSSQGEGGSAPALPPFRFALDASAPTVTTGGWAKHVTVRRFPIARDLSGVHMFLDAGASRELHWHSLADEWAFVIAGRCQTVVLSPEGTSEINDFGPGDLWYFPKGHGHAIQTIGDAPCHFILVFNDGEESPEFGTFGITDWISVTPKGWLAQNFAMPAERFDAFPKGEVYLQAGPVLLPAEALEAPWPRASTHRFALSAERAAVREFAGGSFRLATVAEWPVSSQMCGGLIEIRPGEMLGLHWHPNSSEWNYVLAGRAQVSLFGARGRGDVAEFAPGDVAYFPRGYGHAIRNTGAEPLRIVQVWDSGRFEEITLAGMIRHAPPRLVSASFPDVRKATLAELRGKG